MTATPTPGTPGTPQLVVTALAVGYLAGYMAAGGATQATAMQAAAGALAWLAARRGASG